MSRTCEFSGENTDAAPQDVAVTDGATEFSILELDVVTVINLKPDVTGLLRTSAHPPQFPVAGLNPEFS